MNNDVKKIAYVVHGLGAEGISSFTVNLMSCLDMNKFDVTIFMAIDDNSIPQLKEELVASYGVKFHRTCDLGSFKRIYTHMKKLKQLLVQTGPYDVIHTNMDLLNGLNLIVAKQAGISKRISHSHTSVSINEGNIIKRIIKSVYKFLMKFMIRLYSTERLGCSELANQYLYGNAKASVIANGIDIKRFVNCKINIPEYKNSLGIDADKKLLVNVARISAPKNPLFLAEIISELKKLRNDFIFAWVGDDILRVALEEKIEELDIKEYFKLLGIRSDIPEILNCSDAFLMPSLFEGMPISMVEAQCCGCKCFVSDRVTKMADMTDGLYLPITDPKRWAMEIDAYLSSNIEKQYPSKDMLLKFTSEFMADEISKAYLS